MTDEETETYIAALLVEREGARSDDRREAIDAELRRAGHDATPPARRARRATVTAEETR